MTETEAMAREAAADRECGYRENAMRGMFLAGWDAAMDYAGKVASEGIEHLDGEVESRS